MKCRLLAAPLYLLRYFQCDTQSFGGRLAGNDGYFFAGNTIDEMLKLQFEGFNLLNKGIFSPYSTGRAFVNCEVLF